MPKFTDLRRLLSGVVMALMLTGVAAFGQKRSNGTDAFNHARKLFSSGARARAASILEKEVQAGRNTAGVSSLLGLIRMLPPHRDARGAHAHFTTALRLDPKHVEASYGMGSLFVDLKEYQAALPHLDRALIQSPKYSVCHGERGQALFGLGRYGEAEAAFRAAHDVPEALEFRALIAHQMGKPVEAADLVTELLKRLGQKHASRPRLRYQRGAFLLLSTRTKQAEADIARAVAAGFVRAEALYQLGRLRYEDDDFDTARKHFLRAVAAPSVRAGANPSPSHAKSWYMLGLMAYKLQDLVTAEKHLRKAIELERYHEHAWYKLGQILMRGGRKDEGRRAMAFHRELQPKLQLIKSCRRSLVNKPDDDKTRFGLAKLLHTFDRSAEAFGQLRAVEARRPNYPGLDELMVEICRTLSKFDLADRYEARIAARKPKKEE